MANFFFGLVVAIISIAVFVIFFNGERNIEFIRNSSLSALQKSQNSAHNTIEKYRQRGEELRNLLIKTSTNVKLYETKISFKENELKLATDNNISNSKIILLQSTINDMKSFQAKLKNVEERVKIAFLKHRDGLELLKMKIDYLESKKEMLAIENSLNVINSIGESISSTESEIDTFATDLEKEIVQLETEIEVSKLLEQK